MRFDSLGLGNYNPRDSERLTPPRPADMPGTGASREPEVDMANKSPTLERTSLRAPGDLRRPLLDRTIPEPGRVPVLALAYAAGMGLFLAVEPTQPWVLLALVGLMGLGVDGIVRAHPRGEFRNPADTAPFLFIPVLFTLASGLFFEELVEGYWNALAVLAATVLFGVAVQAVYVSVDTQAPSHAAARFVLNILTYLTAFAFFSVVYSFDVALLPSALAVGLVSLLLAVEVFREAEADPVRTLVFAAATGLIVGEMRWMLYFVPLEGFLAAVVLLLAFYLTSGLIHHHLIGHLNRTVAIEFTLVMLAGLGIVILGGASV